MKEAKCYLCGSGEYEVIYRYEKPDRYAEKCMSAEDKTYYRELRVCKNCSHVFNVQSISGIERVYDGFWSQDFHGQSPKELFNAIVSLTPDKSENFSRVAWLRQQLEQISNAFDILKDHPRRVLDVGCGLGIFLNGFLDDQWKGFGIDPSPYACDLVRRELKIPVVCSRYKQGLFNEKFDLITLIHVLEHIDNPIEFLKNVKNDMKPKGVVFIESPEVLELSYSSKDHEAFASEHYHLFSPGTILVTAERAGLLPIVIEREMSPRPRRRIKLLAVKADNLIAENVMYRGSYKQILQLRDVYLSKTNEK